MGDILAMERLSYWTGRIKIRPVFSTWDVQSTARIQLTWAWKVPRADESVAPLCSAT